MSSARYRLKMDCGTLYIVDTQQKERCFEWQDKRGFRSVQIAQVLASKKLSHREIAKMICSALNKLNKSRRGKE